VLGEMGTMVEIGGLEAVRSADQPSKCCNKAESVSNPAPPPAGVNSTYLVVHILQHVSHIELGERADDATVEASFHADNLLDDLGNLLLSRFSIVDDREDDGADLVLLAGRSGDVLDEIIGLEGRRKFLASLRESCSGAILDRPLGDSEGGGGKVERVNGVDGGALFPP
jgi:hypothetical protein